MVVNMVWVQSWSVVLISLSVLFFAVLLLLCCVCWEKKDNRVHQLYILDENGMKIVNNSYDPEGSFFRRFSPNANLTPFTKCGILNEKYRNNIENEAANDLVDSFDVDKQFDSTTLKIEPNETYILQENINETVRPGQNFNETYTLERKINVHLQDDNVSSSSGSSRTTFYSVYPSYMRTTSVPETMKSALSQCDLNSLEE